jgi:tRNA threonylcarbamoyladenosine biosynthesis protein TsaB
VRILAFDTATRATTVALCDLDPDGQRTAGAGAVWLEARDDPPPGARPRHVARLMPLIAELLEQAGCTWTGIDRLAVGRGPGTFTGLRIAVATARALAGSLRRPLVGVSTLESLALNSERVDARSDAVAAVLDARRGEVFAAAWRIQTPRGGGMTPSMGERLMAPSALAPEVLAQRLPGLGKAPLALGDGAIEFRPILERTGVLIPGDEPELHRVTAINHCRLAASLAGAAPDEIQPEYLRLPDAEIARRAAGPQ